MLRFCSVIPQHQWQEDGIGMECLVRHYVRPDAVLCHRSTSWIDAGPITHTRRPSQRPRHIDLGHKADRDLIRRHDL